MPLFLERPIHEYSIAVNFYDSPTKKNRINVVYAISLEDYDRGKSLGNIGGCSCSFRYYRFLSMRRQPTTTTCISV